MTITPVWHPGPVSGRPSLPLRSGHRRIDTRLPRCQKTLRQRDPGWRSRSHATRPRRLGCPADGLLFRGGGATVVFRPGASSAQCAERRADLFSEELRLFPGGEVAALVDLVVVDEVGVGPFGPASRRLILLVREDARGHRDGHALGVEEATPVFPSTDGTRRPPCS